MNGLHFYLWHYWDVSAYFGCVLFLLLALFLVWLAAKMINRTWAARNSGSVFTYALMVGLFPFAFLYFNAAAAQRILDHPQDVLGRHVYQLNRTTLRDMLQKVAQNDLPPTADEPRVRTELFRRLCEYVQTQSTNQHHALPLPLGEKVGDDSMEKDLQAFLYREVFRHRHHGKRMDELVTPARTKQINKAISRHLCTEAYQQNEADLQSAAEPMWPFMLLWSGLWLLWTMYRAYSDIKHICPYRA